MSDIQQILWYPAAIITSSNTNITYLMADNHLPLVIKDLADTLVHWLSLLMLMNLVLSMMVGSLRDIFHSIE